MSGLGYFVYEKETARPQKGQVIPQHQAACRPPKTSIILALVRVNF